MSTHSAVGVKTATGFKGRYVHFDGYPAAMIPVLKTIIEHDGWQAAATMITEVVPGYGIAYGEGHEGTDWWDETDLRGPCSWAYALTENGVEVWEHDYSEVSGAWIRRKDREA